VEGPTCATPFPKICGITATVTQVTIHIDGGVEIACILR